MVVFGAVLIQAGFCVRFEGDEVSGDFTYIAHEADSKPAHAKQLSDNQFSSGDLRLCHTLVTVPHANLESGETATPLGS